MGSDLKIEDWGLIEYDQALRKQMEKLEQVHAGMSPDTLIFCSHPPVVTLGRSSKPEDVTDWAGDLVQVSRGGRATYHGPNQLLVYPIVSLDRGSRAALPARDVHRYLRVLETSIVAGLAALGVSSEVRQTTDPGGLSLTGVWVGERKVASIGIAVKKWITYHGVAINLEFDPKAFRGISPCGFTVNTMISVEEVIGKEPDRETLKMALAHHLAQSLAIN